VDEFCGKIKAAKDAQTDPDFVVVARIESFIAGHGLSDALDRADAYFSIAKNQCGHLRARDERRELASSPGSSIWI
jgi:hypothetical protein